MSTHQDPLWWQLRNAMEPRKKKERKGKEDSQVATMPRQAMGEMNYYRAHHKFHTPTQKGPADKRGNQLDPRTSPSASILSRSVPWTTSFCFTESQALWIDPHTLSSSCWKGDTGQNQFLKKTEGGLLWWSGGWDSTLPMQRLGSIPGQGTRSCMPQRRPGAAKLINKIFLKKKKGHRRKRIACETPVK